MYSLYLPSEKIGGVIFFTLNYHLFRFLAQSWITLNSHTQNKYHFRYLTVQSSWLSRLYFANLIQKLEPAFFLTASTSFIRRLTRDKSYKYSQYKCCSSLLLQFIIVACILLVAVGAAVHHKVAVVGRIAEAVVAVIADHIAAVVVVHMGHHTVASPLAVAVGVAVGPAAVAGSIQVDSSFAPLPG